MDYIRGLGVMTNRDWSIKGKTNFEMFYFIWPFRVQFVHAELLSSFLPHVGSVCSLAF
jgi:hypothetical protein